MRRLMQALLAAAVITATVTPVALGAGDRPPVMPGVPAVGPTVPVAGRPTSLPVASLLVPPLPVPVHSVPPVLGAGSLLLCGELSRSEADFKLAGHLVTGQGADLSAFVGRKVCAVVSPLPGRADDSPRLLAVWRVWVISGNLAPILPLSGLPDGAPPWLVRVMGRASGAGTRGWLQ